MHIKGTKNINTVEYIFIVNILCITLLTYVESDMKPITVVFNDDENLSAALFVWEYEFECTAIVDCMQACMELPRTPSRNQDSC